MPTVRDPKTGRLMKAPESDNKIDGTLTFAGTTPQNTAVLERETEQVADIIGLEPGDALAPLPVSDLLPEPITFTDPDRPNRRIVGSEVLGVNERTGRLAVKPRPRIVFTNGHVIVTKRSEAERVRKACPSCFQEPSAAERTDMRPFEALDHKGRVVFTTYLRDAYERFKRVYALNNR